MNYYEENKMLCKSKEKMRKFVDIKFNEEKDAFYFYIKLVKRLIKKKEKIY